jgi:plastocyanin
MRTSRKLATCSALGLALILGVPAAAGAAQKDVSMGPPRAAQKALQPTASDVNDFFPHQVTVHVGDTVRFVPNGFHTVDLPGRRTRRLPPFVPTGQPIAGSVDAAGAPFWFNGQSLVGFNPTLFASAFGKRRAYTGARAVLSGIPQSERPKPMTVRFTRTGTFRYLCDIHLGMTGVVRVVRRSRLIPSAAADRRTLRRQVATTLATAKALAKSPPAPAANTVNIGAQGKGNVTMLAFVPSALTVPAGTTVTFRMDARTEVHTATIGPGDPGKQPQSYLGQLEVGLQGGAVFDPRLAFPSEPPGALAALTPTFHGNGFWNSGALDQDSTTTIIPPANVVNFAAPGAYQVFCMIHPFMHATVTVQ